MPKKWMIAAAMLEVLHLQPMLSQAAGGAPITAATWQTKKGWALIATRGRNINPDLYRSMAKHAAARLSKFQLATRCTSLDRMMWLA